MQMALYRTPPRRRSRAVALASAVQWHLFYAILAALLALFMAWLIVRE